MNNKNKKGFTLTELIVVIVIIAILAAVLIPTLTGTVNKSRKSAASQEAASMNTLYKAWLVDTVEDGGYDADNDKTDLACLVSFAKYYAIQSNVTTDKITWGESPVTATVDGVLIQYVGDDAENLFVMRATNGYYVRVTMAGETSYEVADTFAGLSAGQSVTDAAIYLDTSAVSVAVGADVKILLIETVANFACTSNATATATAAFSGHTLTIHGAAAGSTTITIAGGSPSATLATITVTVTA